MLNLRNYFQLPKLLPMDSSQPHHIVCGTEHLLLISTDGSLWAWGGNRYGQCGVGHRENVRDVEVSSFFAIPQEGRNCSESPRHPSESSIWQLDNFTQLPSMKKAASGPGAGLFGGSSDIVVVDASKIGCYLPKSTD